MRPRGSGLTHLHFLSLHSILWSHAPAPNPAAPTHMELYYKDLISEDASLDKLVDELMLVVQGASELAEAAGSELAPERRAELRSKIETIKEACNRIKEHAVSGMRATDKLLRQYPYSSLGFAFGLGVLTAVLVQRVKK